MPLKRVSLKITGRVQGVGLRPTVFNYAKTFSLVGHVINTSQGVFIEIEGDSDSVEGFIYKLKNDPPPLAKIDNFNELEIELKGDKEFRIDLSHGRGEKNVEISPDVATCKDCLNDILDKDDRRYQYPFTNCTNCGPRFTIIKDRPYDRELTSMGEFLMCSKCRSEYDNPMDRRFHAQPNACSVCGPKLYMLSGESEGCIKYSVDQIKDGKIIGIKGLGGFNVACDPFNSVTVKRLRDIKRRPTKAFAIMVKDLETVQKICFVNDREREALTSASAPIVLLKKKNNIFDHLAPDNNYMGVMIPYTPIHYLLFEALDYLIMTSANKREEPIAINDDQIREMIEEGILDNALSHNREIVNRCDDSIIQFVGNRMQIIRRSRGFVPAQLCVKGLKNKKVLALGANMKNTFVLRNGEKLYSSQHIGELIDYRNYEYQKRQIKEFESLLEIDVKETHCDAHPGYENYNEKHQQIFHHHAHMLSVMGEHNLIGKECLGVICDGTGFGTDENIWGFEFIKSRGDQSFERVTHLNYFVLPGGEKAIYQVDRIGISLLQGIENNIFDEDRKKMIESVIKSDINCPKTSSLGRLFDGVSAILEIVEVADYEAQAAILLQKSAESYNPTKLKNRYSVSFSETIDYKSMIIQMIDDLNQGQSVNEMAYKFHVWTIDVMILVIEKVQNIGKTPVVISGGCFQNVLLAKLLEERLKELDIEYYFNEQVPSNDAGISFGQALI